jgi:hypothetical protein
MEHLNCRLVNTVVYNFKGVPRPVITNDKVLIVKTRHQFIGDAGFEHVLNVRPCDVMLEGGRRIGNLLLYTLFYHKKAGPAIFDLTKMMSATFSLGAGGPTIATMAF